MKIIGTKAATITQLRGADWDGVERDVLTRIRLLRGMVEHLPENEVNNMIARDLLVPAIGLLGEFCSRVKIADEANAHADLPAVAGKVRRVVGNSGGSNA